MEALKVSLTNAPALPTTDYSTEARDIVLSVDASGEGDGKDTEGTGVKKLAQPQHCGESRYNNNRDRVGIEPPHVQSIYDCCSLAVQHTDSVPFHCHFTDSCHVGDVNQCSPHMHLSLS